MPHSQEIPKNSPTRRERAVLAKWGAPAPASPPVAVPAGFEPVGYLEHGAAGSFLAYSKCDANPQEPVFTATQVQAMLAAAQAVPASLITASIMRDDGGEHPAFCLMAAYRSEKDATDALAMPTDAPAQPRDDAVFVVWWSDHMPNSTGADAWAEWCALRSNQPDPAAPAKAGEYPELTIRFATYDAWGNQTKHGYNADDMRAYADATCAARKPLTDGQVSHLIELFSCGEEYGHDVHGIARAIEAAHGIT